MSGFITTMFVSSLSEPHSVFPTKPKLLVPVFTFTQSQSCMNLMMDLEVVDSQRKTLDITKPKGTQRSPLQKIGEALRLPQSQSASIANKPAPKQQPESKPSNESNSPTRDFIKYSYEVLSPAAPPTRPSVDRRRHYCWRYTRNSQPSRDWKHTWTPSTGANSSLPTRS